MDGLGEFLGALDHGRVAAAVDPRELRVGDEFMELLGDLGGRDGVLHAPEEEGGMLDGVDAIAHMVGLGGAAEPDDGAGGVSLGEFFEGAVDEVGRDAVLFAEEALDLARDPVVGGSVLDASLEGALEEARRAGEDEGLAEVGPFHGDALGDVPAEGVADEDGGAADDGVKDGDGESCDAVDGAGLALEFEEGHAEHEALGSRGEGACDGVPVLVDAEQAVEEHDGFARADLVNAHGSANLRIGLVGAEILGVDEGCGNGGRYAQRRCSDGGLRGPGNVTSGAGPPRRHDTGLGWERVGRGSARRCDWRPDASRVAGEQDVWGRDAGGGRSVAGGGGGRGVRAAGAGAGTRTSSGRRWRTPGEFWVRRGVARGDRWRDPRPCG